MRHILSTTMTFFALVTGIHAQDAQLPRARVDVGGGIILLRGNTDTSTPFNQGLGFTLGVRVQNGLLLRFDVGEVESKGCQTGDFGFGNDTLCGKDQMFLVDATVGYLWNRAGRVRPYLRGGAQWVFLEETFNSFRFANSAKSSDNAQVLAYGGGIEIGDNGHTFAFDYLRTTQVDMALFDSAVEFYLGQVRFDYRFRF